MAGVVELTYLHVIVKCESLLGGHGKGRCTVSLLLAKVLFVRCAFSFPGLFSAVSWAPNSPGGESSGSEVEYERRSVLPPLLNALTILMYLV